VLQKQGFTFLLDLSRSRFLLDLSRSRFLLDLSRSRFYWIYLDQDFYWIYLDQDFYWIYLDQDFYWIYLDQDFYWIYLDQDGDSNESFSRTKGGKFPEYIYIFFCFGATAPSGARASLFTSFLNHTQRRTAVGRTPLDE